MWLVIWSLAGASVAGALPAAPHAGPQLKRSLARSEQALEVTGHGTLTERVAAQWNSPWVSEEPKQMAKDNVGGSATKNAFMGEDRFLQDASGKAQKQSLHQPPAALNEGFQAAAVGAQNSFASEQEFLNAAPVPIRWAQHSDKCFCGKQPTEPGGITALVIWRCDDSEETDNMKFILPAGGNGKGQIKWAADPSFCIYVRNGWEGNGNSVYLWKCDDTAKQESMSFTVLTNAVSSGLSSIEWTKAELSSRKCLDVHDMSSNDGNTIELWDCSAGSMWQIY